jgi:tRNA-guanine family transglycosylase
VTYAKFYQTIFEIASNNVGFDGIAIGGLVPRARDLNAVLSIVEAVRQGISDLPQHIFGLGKPEIVAKRFQTSVNSVDSSSYVKMADDGKLWGHSNDKLLGDISPSDRVLPDATIRRSIERLSWRGGNWQYTS